MLKITIPQYRDLELEYLVLDYNGTLALDGKLSELTKRQIREISKILKIYVLTADTYGTVEEELEGLPLELLTFPKGEAKKFKGELIDRLGPSKCIAVGNGRNDYSMLKKANLAIGVLDEEGLYPGLLEVTHILARSTASALDLILNPKRIVADLRG